MKNYLLAIDNEITSFYEKFLKRLNDEELEVVSKSFSEDIIALLDYYLSLIFINGKSVIQKRLSLNKKLELNDDEENFIKNYKLTNLSQFGDSINNAVINCFNNRINDIEFINQLTEIIVSFCISFFKLSQLMECQNNDIEFVQLTTNNDSCSHCQTLSKFNQKVSDLIKNIDQLHSFCKLIINVDNLNKKNLSVGKVNFINMPINYENKIKLIIKNLQISIPNLISNKDFEFVDNISNDNNFILSLENNFNEDKINELLKLTDNQIVSFDINDKILISNKCNNQLEYLIVKYLIKDKIQMNNEVWWKEQYYKRQNKKYIGDNVVIFANPFITYEAEQNYESYFLESVIYYIINPKLLKTIDNDCYMYLKENVYNNLEFLRG